MHFGTAHSLVVVALVASIWLVLQGGDRLFPVLAAVAAGLEALIAFNIVTMSVSKFRIDVILPALLVVAAGMCWTKNSTKGGITAATAAALVGLLQLLVAVHVLD